MQISSNGGFAPRWRRDGRELFYIDPEQRLVAVEITTSPVFRVGKSSPLFTLPARLGPAVATGAYVYDVSLDGQRFLVSMAADGADATNPRAVPLTVVTNWTALLKK